MTKHFSRKEMKISGKNIVLLLQINFFFPSNSIPECFFMF
jgi:hypothetical protein